MWKAQGNENEERNVKERTYKIVGKTRILLHSAELADPLADCAKQVKELTDRKKRTPDEDSELARREWFGSLYLDEEGRVVIPAQNIERMIRDAAARTRNGKNVQAGLQATDDFFPLDFPGKGLTAKQLWESGKYTDRSSVKVNKGRSIRTRPCFRDWSLTFTVMYDPGILSASQLDGFVAEAGRIIGLGDWRPRNGRFDVESAK